MSALSEEAVSMLRRGFNCTQSVLACIGRREGLSREMAVGLTWRPLAETARDTLDWYYATPAAEQEGLRGASLRPEREKEVLALWHARG